MHRRWTNNKVTDEKALLAFKQEMDLACTQKGISTIPPSLLKILFLRGIDSFAKARDFFNPSLSQLHSPFLMKDMDVAVERINRAIRDREKILIYGDYDVDGTTAVALVYGFLRKYHSDIDYYIPDRYTEGYGISLKGIDYAKEHGFALIIALDCGITAVAQVDYANSLGVDFVVCDHHLPSEKLPDAVAILDPKRVDCAYPYKELSGCGVGFKLVQAFAQNNHIHFSELERYLDLVAISIASDIVSVTGENRILAHFGLNLINSNPSVGVSALMDSAGKKDNYTISDIVFNLGPRINAAGRIDDAKNAVSLMVTENHQVAKERGQLIDSQNAERKGHDSSITEEALAMIDGDEALQNKTTTVVYGEHWHKGVIGIVASRLTEKYYRPTIVLTKSNGHLAGSARSVAGFDLYDALSDCKHLLEQFGGHKFAAGLTMKEENLPEFTQCFEQVVRAKILDEQLVQEVLIDDEIALEDITGKFCRIVKQMAPFGPDNMSPVFLTKGLQARATSVSLVGKNHLRMKVKQNDSAIFDCIGFGMGSFFEALDKGKMFDICYTIEENVWKDRVSTQLNLKAIRLN